MSKKISREGMLCKTGDTKKDRVYDFQKYKTMWSLGLVISNGATTLENATNDQVYLKGAFHNFKNLQDLNKKRKKLLKTQLSFSHEDNGLLMPLIVKYFQGGLQMLWMMMMVIIIMFAIMSCIS